MSCVRCKRGHIICDDTCLLEIQGTPCLDCDIFPVPTCGPPPVTAKEEEDARRFVENIDKAVLEDAIKEEKPNDL